MKQVRELITQHREGSEKQTGDAQSQEAKYQTLTISEKHIERIWERMSMMYGHKWTSSYGECDDGTWLAGLQGITLEQIGEGLIKCRDSKEEWPPTLNQFRNYCRNEQIGLTHNTAAYKVIPTSHRLEKKADKGKAMEEIKKLKDILK